MILYSIVHMDSYHFCIDVASHQVPDCFHRSLSLFYHSYSINFDFLSVVVHVTVGVHTIQYVRPFAN